MLILCLYKYCLKKFHNIIFNIIDYQYKYTLYVYIASKTYTVVLYSRYLQSLLFIIFLQHQTHFELLSNFV